MATYFAFCGCIAVASIISTVMTVAYSKFLKCIWCFCGLMIGWASQQVSWIQIITLLIAQRGNVSCTIQTVRNDTRSMFNLRFMSCYAKKICSWRFEIGPWTWYKSGLRKPVYLVWTPSVKYDGNNFLSFLIQSQFHLKNFEASSHSKALSKKELYFVSHS